MASKVEIDPVTGEVVEASKGASAVQIDPNTGEVVARSSAAKIDPTTGEVIEVAVAKTTTPSKPPVEPIIPRFDIASATAALPRHASKTTIPATREEAAAAAGRLGLSDEELAAVINPEKPTKVRGVDILKKRDEDLKLASQFVENERVIKGLKAPSATPAPLPTETAPSDAIAIAAKKPAAPITLKTPATTIEPLVPAAPTDATTAPAEAPAPAPETRNDAKLVERAQSLAEAVPSFAKGFTTGATAGLVNPESGTEGAPGSLGRIAGNLAAGIAAGYIRLPALAVEAGVALTRAQKIEQALRASPGASAFLMTQFLTDLEERGMDTARMTDPEILALAATSGLMGGATPVAFGKKLLTRALTGAGLGAAQNVAEEDIMAQITGTEPARLRAAILGGAFGAGFGAAFRDNPKVHEAVVEKLPEADVKMMDEVAADLPTTDAAPAQTLKAESGLTLEAENLLKAVDEVTAKGGTVPEEITPELSRLAVENEIPITTETKAQDVVDALREKAGKPAEAAAVAPEAAVEPVVGAEAVVAPEATAAPVEPPPAADVLPESGPVAEATPAPRPDEDEAVKLWREKKTESPYFKKWFGDSKVVDENGKPMVVYHGTSKDFDKFTLGSQGENFDDYEGAIPRDGFWFTDSPRNAEGYAYISENGLEGERGGDGGQKIIPTYLSLKNPYRYTIEKFAAEGEAGIPTQFELEKQGYDGIIVEVAEANDGSSIPADAQAMWEKYVPIHGAPMGWPKDLRARYDKLLDVAPKLKHINYVVFNPEQIKSATGNSGRFDPTSASITDRTPNKPFGSTPEGIVRAPYPDERVTSNRKAWTHQEREYMGLNRLNSPEREAIQTALDEAKAKNMDADAEALAESVLSGGERRLTRPQAASMGIRKMQLLTQFDAAVEHLKDLTDPLEINAQAREMDAIRTRFDRLTEALVQGNSEAGRDLNFAKMTLDKDFNLLPVLARAKAKKGGALTPEVEAKFKELTDKLKEYEAKAVEAEKRAKEVEAREAITTQKRISRAARKPREQLKAEIADLTEQTRRLFAAGCLTS